MKLEPPDPISDAVVLLRPFALDDIDDIHIALNDPELVERADLTFELPVAREQVVDLITDDPALAASRAWRTGRPRRLLDAPRRDPVGIRERARASGRTGHSHHSHRWRS